MTAETRLRCEGADDHRADRRDQGGSDDNGGHGTEPGDDNGGRGNEPGDDNGGNPGSGPSAEGGAEPGEASSCTTAALVPGALVADAELRFGNGTATFTEVELGHDS